MKNKCQICGTVEETYPDSPNHILKLCNKHWHGQRYKKMEDFITWFYENHEMEYTKYHYEFLKSTGQMEG